MHLKTIETYDQEQTTIGPCALMTPHLVSGQVPEPVNSHTSLIELKAAGTKLLAV